ncbi:MAG TPA: RagB/SusD family nutrient uptake outer membrane protein [Longimicrobiaceae bacterium]|nr:RagB/SusD family nutrient uptake outer membrane protein [Longimicrobiaceae bacterium]
MHTQPNGGRAVGRGVLPLLLAAALLLAGCDELVVPDYNNPSLEDLQNNPTRTAVQTAATGLLIGARANISESNGYVSLLGILGRESYNLDGSEPRFVTEMLINPLSPSGAFGGNLWALRYRNIRNANLVLQGTDRVSGFSNAEKEAIRGFAKTMMALDYLLVINTRDANGAVVDASRPLSEGPGALVGRAEVFNHIVRLLDEAQAHLNAGGGAFPFPLSAGFAAFNTPATFRQFNRALKARVDVYLRNYPQALTDLQGSFLNPSGSLTLGAYHSFGTGSGETPNGLVAVTIFAHPSIMAGAERQPGGALDQRVLGKVVQGESRTQLGVTSDLRFILYPSNTSPVPIIRNEELILLRAEARWFTGDRVGATADLNLIRQRSGGLAPIAQPANDDAFVTALLKERFYSLLFEGGHRWIDHRRFGRLDQLPRLPGHTVHPRFPIPEAECLARGQPTCQA